MQEGAAVFATIEDFMWFMIALVRRTGAPDTSGAFPVHPDLICTKT